MLLNSYVEGQAATPAGRAGAEGIRSFWTPFLERCRVEEVRFPADVVTAHCVLALESLGWRRKRHSDPGEDEYLAVEGHDELLARLEWVVRQGGLALTTRNVWHTGSTRQRGPYCVSAIPVPQNVFSRFTRIPGTVVADKRLLRAIGAGVVED
jgi:hypothetical protein